MSSRATIGMLLLAGVVAGAGVVVWLFAPQFASPVVSGPDNDRMISEGNSQADQPANLPKSDNGDCGNSDQHGRCGSDATEAPDNILFGVFLSVAFGYEKFVRIPISQAQATVFWKTGTEEEQRLVLEESPQDGKTRSENGSMFFTLPPGRYECRLAVEGFEETTFFLNPEARTVRLKLKPATTLHVTIESDSGNPLPPGSFYLFTADPPWIAPNGRFADSAKSYLSPLQMKRNGAISIASVGVVAEPSDVSLELTPYRHGRDIRELPSEVQVVFEPSIEWPAWLPRPYKNATFAAGRVSLGNLAAAQTGRFIVYDFPELPIIPEVEVSDGIELVRLHSGFPGHWDASARSNFDGCATISAEQGTGLVRYRRDILGDGLVRVILEAPIWRQVGGVVLDAEGAPVVRASIGFQHEIVEAPRQWFRVEDKTDEQGQFLLRYADVVPPTEVHVSAPDFKSTNVQLSEVVDAMKIKVQLESDD